MVYDVVIIGAGVTGCAIARELSKNDLTIAILEKEEEPAFGVSKSNSGIIHPGTQNPSGSLKGRLCVRGNAMMRGLCGDLGVDLKEVGELIVAFKSEDTDELKKIKNEAETLGVPGLRMVNSAWLKKNEPNLSEQAVAALYAPTACIISPYRLVYALAENAVRNGAELYFSSGVSSVRKRRRDGVFSVAAGSRVFEARYVVNAAGLFADEISSMAGAGNFKITPRKGEEFLLDKKRRNITRHLIFPLPSRMSKGILVIKTSDGNPMIGPTAEDVDEKEDLSTTAGGFEKVVMEARKMVPSIEPSDIIAYFAGLRPVCGNDFLIRQEKELPGFVNVAGIQSPGLTAAPAISEMVAAILADNGLSLRKKKRFHGTREKTKHLFDMSPGEIEEAVKNDPDYGDIVCRCETVSKKEIVEAVSRGARTLDGIKFRTRAQAGRCHGSFCTARILRILAEERSVPFKEITKRGKGSEIVKEER
jgi:glycerol-3-phosphate dehydrogenase